ncbi:MAG: hypothetical protein WCO35_02730 [Candidatus Nomurabacteria bacterium]
MSDRKGGFTQETYDEVNQKVKDAGGDTSHAGRQTIRDTGKLHPLVDPAGYDLIRRSLPRYLGETFKLPNGMPMLTETLGDTTGSMGGNVKLMFDSLPKFYSLLTEGKYPVLGNYDPQVMNAIFGDVQDNFVLARTQAEMDKKIAEQLTLMVPEREGGDSDEDPEYGLFGAAYLTDAFISRYGLKYYHFMVTDAKSHGRVDKRNLVRVFSEEVFEKVKENCQISFDEKNLPDTKDIVKALQKQAHAFAILVESPESYWSKFYGPENVVVIDSTENLPYVQSTLIGLTEGVFGLNDVTEYLKSVGLNKAEAIKIQRAVANIPVGAQTQFENFSKIPKKGSIFANKHDLWPLEITDMENHKPEKPKQHTWM